MSYNKNRFNTIFTERWGLINLDINSKIAGYVQEKVKSITQKRS